METETIVQKDRKKSQQYSAQQVIRGVLELLVKNLPTEKLNEGFYALFGETLECDRKSFMGYDDVYIFNKRNGGWILAFGIPGGKSYLFGGMEADIVLVRVKEWPARERLMWEVFRCAPFLGGGNADRFRFSTIASKDGVVVCHHYHKSRLRKWVKRKYGSRECLKLTPIDRGEFGNAENVFCSFLPQSLPYDDQLIQDLYLQFAQYIRH